MSSQKRNAQPHLLKEILEGVVRQFPQKIRFDELNIKDTWQSVMGKPIAEQTQNIYLKNNILHIKIVSSVLRQELMMHKSKIRNLINEKFRCEMVKDIYFV